MWPLPGTDKTPKMTADNEHSTREVKRKTSNTKKVAGLATTELDLGLNKPMTDCNSVVFARGSHNLLKIGEEEDQWSVGSV